MKRKPKIADNLLKSKKIKALPLQEVRLLKNLLQTNYFCVGEFIIFGAPARKSNQRQYTGSSFVLGKSAMQYVNIFDKQIKRIQKSLPTPLDQRNYIWVFEIYYNRINSDASIELAFDLMQKHEIIVDDVNIRNYLVLAEELDKQVPRTKITIYTLNNPQINK
jgi:hypothetical protein